MSPAPGSCCVFPVSRRVYHQEVQSRAYFLSPPVAVCVKPDEQQLWGAEADRRAVIGCSLAGFRFFRKKNKTIFFKLFLIQTQMLLICRQEESRATSPLFLGPHQHFCWLSHDLGGGDDGCGSFCAARFPRACSDAVLSLCVLHPGVPAAFSPGNLSTSSSASSTLGSPDNDEYILSFETIDKMRRVSSYSSLNSLIGNLAAVVQQRCSSSAGERLASNQASGSFAAGVASGWRGVMKHQ